MAGFLGYIDEPLVVEAIFNILINVTEVDMDYFCDVILLTSHTIG